MQNRGKALFLFSDSTGIGTVNRHLEEVQRRLSKVFDTLDVCQTYSAEEGFSKAVEACGVYDALIFSGGDGTFNNMVSALVGRKDAPTLGYINGGTLCDAGKNFGVHGSFRRALKIIEEGYSCGFDVGRINDQYFTYVATVGAFADIPYIAKRKYKKRMGRLTYYIQAVKEAFIPTKFHCHIVADGVTYDQKTPFILCMSGRNIAGFPVNGGDSAIHDGKFELFLTKPGLFNGLLHYLFFKIRTVKISARSFQIDLDYPDAWDLDGEMGPIGNVQIEALDSGLRMFCAKKFADLDK